MLSELESISCNRPDRAFRLQGQMGDGEALEVVIFRGFSSSLTHPTAFDPDQPLLPSEATINSAVLLQAPITIGCHCELSAPRDPAYFLSSGNWE